MTRKSSAISAWRSMFAKPGTTDQEPVLLGPHKIYILPTRAGLLFFILLLTMLLISINYNNPPGYLLTFLLAGVGFVSIFHTHRTLHGLRISHVPARPVFAGDTARFQVVIRNPAAADRHAIRVSWSRLGKGPVRDISAKTAARFTLPRPAPARGRLSAGRFVVSSVHPLGLCRAWSPMQLAMSCIVYPQPETDGPKWTPSLPDRADQSGKLHGTGPTGRDGDDFSGLRTYRLGDPPRQVAWKATARGETMYSKEFALQGEHAVIWLQWPDVPQGDVETALSRLCRWALEAHAAGSPYGLMLPERRVEPSTGPGHLDICLTALALYQSSSPITTGQSQAV
jgi:uncharacterized protein (DUF58 family)